MKEYDKEEVWKEIENYEGLYQVSNMGRVKSLNYGHTGEERILKQGRCGKYLKVELSKNRRLKAITVHRLVATAFIPNPDNLPCINHKDENPFNNAANNLEWCTYKYNNNYGTRTQRASEAKRGKYNTKVSKPVLQFTKQGEFIKEHPSTMEAQRQTRVLNGNISLCCSGRRKSAGGFIWKYKI